MTVTARRKQTAITIRSARAAERLALLTRDGRSQARVIEEALDQMPLPAARIDRQAIRAEIAAIVARGRDLPVKSIEDIDAEMYDENGMPR
jgi:antitoxin VapB